MRVIGLTHLETGGAPVDELNGPFGLDGGDGGVDIFRDDVAAVEEATRHVPSCDGRLPVGAAGGADGALGAPSLKWAPGRRLGGA